MERIINSVSVCCIFFFVNVSHKVKTSNQFQLGYGVLMMWLLSYSFETRKHSFHVGLQAFMKFYPSHLGTEMDLVKMNYLVFYHKNFTHHFSHYLKMVL